MTKPIDWTTTRKEDVPQRRHLEVCVCEERDQPRPGGWQKVDQQWATPSDLASALAAMGEGERAEVLQVTAAHGLPGAVVVRAVSEVKMIEDLRAELRRCQDERAATVNRIALERETARGERDALRIKLVDTERERDDARLRCGAALATAATATARAEKAESFAADLRGIIGSLVDRIAAGARVTDRTWDEACLHSGRYTEDYLSKGGQEEAAELKRDQETTTLRVRAEKAERERDEAREARDRSTRLRDAMMPDTRAALDAEQYEDALTAARRVVAERDDLRGKIEALETELFSARLTLGSLQHEEDVTRRQLKAEPCESIPGALRRVVQGLERERDEALYEQGRLLQSNARYSAAADEALRDRDEARLDLDRAQAALAVVRHDLEGTRRDLGDLRTRLISAETAAAQREPREYPLAEGSRWEGDMIVDNCNLGTRLSDGGWRPLVVSGGHTSPYLADVLALAHRRGLL